MLRDATSQARRALLAKSEFLAKMSHELKNPLSAIIGYSEILIEDAGGAETQKRKDLTSIRSAGHRLLGLIDNLLELSRLEAGKVDLRVEEFELSECFEKLVSRCRPAIAASGNTLIEQPPPAGRIVCDLQKLQRIVEGLLSNAAKFTKDGRITVSASMQGDSWTISIVDSGVGIAQARMVNLFETFGRSEDETTSKYVDEVGLGLPLAYRYCQLMGGNLSVQSKLGVGTTVDVSLPRQVRSVEKPSDTRTELRWHAA
jgi:signal transduction histidine kinase